MVLNLLEGSKPNPIASVPLAVGADDLGGQPDLHAQRHVLGIGRDVDQVGPHAGASAVDQGGHVGDRNPGAAKLTMVKARTSPSVGMSTGRTRSGRSGTGVAPVEEPGAAGGALVGHQVGLVAEHQVVDQRDLLGHRPHFRCLHRRLGRHRSGEDKSAATRAR